MTYIVATGDPAQRPVALPAALDDLLHLVGSELQLAAELHIVRHSPPSAPRRPDEDQSALMFG
jgi:hypothetical protein